MTKQPHTYWKVFFSHSHTFSETKKLQADIQTLTNRVCKSGVHFISCAHEKHKSCPRPQRPLQRVCVLGKEVVQKGPFGCESLWRCRSGRSGKVRCHARNVRQLHGGESPALRGIAQVLSRPASKDPSGSVSFDAQWRCSLPAFSVWNEQKNICKDFMIRRWL